MSVGETIYCCECQQEVETVMVSGSHIYPHRKDLYYLKFYQCLICKNKVGVHKSTGNPLGVIPNMEISSFRKKIHEKIDPLWKNGFLKRKTIYRVMSIQFGMEYHTARLKNIRECEWALHHAELLQGIVTSYGKGASKKLDKLGWYRNEN